MISKYILKVCDFKSGQFLNNYLIFHFKSRFYIILVGISPNQKGNLGRRGLGLKTSMERYLSLFIRSFHEDYVLLKFSDKFPH
jgi:hypothetical protein